MDDVFSINMLFDDYENGGENCYRLQILVEIMDIDDVNANVLGVFALRYLTDGPTTGSIPEKLIGPANYRGWKRSMEVALSSKRKLGFVTGLVKRDADDAEKQDQWDTCNNMVIAWLTSSMSPSVKESVMYMTTAKDIWSHLERRFALINGTRKYKLNREVYDLKQRDRTVTEYFTMMKTMWDELDGMSQRPAITTVVADVTAYVESMEKEKAELRLFQFLMGLNDEYSPQRSHILMFTPLPSVEEACSRIVDEESQRAVLKEEKEEYETAAMYGKKEEQCSVCGRKGHNKEKCWKVIGFPKWHPMAKKQLKEGEGSSGSYKKDRWMKGKGPHSGPKLAAQAQMEDNVTFTGEQLEKLMRMVPHKSKEGTETEDEIDHGFAGLTMADY